MSRYDGWEEAPTRQMSKQYFDDKTFFVDLKQGRKKSQRRRKPTLDPE